LLVPAAPLSMQSYGVASRTAVIPGRLPHRTEEFASRNSFPISVSGTIFRAPPRVRGLGELASDRAGSAVGACPLVLRV